MNTGEILKRAAKRELTAEQAVDLLMARRWRFRHPYVAALLALFGCSCARVPPPSPPPSYDASDAAPYVAGDGAGETDCQRACDRLTAVCGPQGVACVVTYALIQDHEEVRKPDGGSLSCKDVLGATDRAGMIAIGVTTCGVAP